VSDSVAEVTVEKADNDRLDGNEGEKTERRKEGKEEVEERIGCR
jgi:hypothetical protein